MGSAVGSGGVAGGKRWRGLLDRRTGASAFDVLNSGLFVLMSLAMLYPFWYVLVLSLNEGKDALKGIIWFWPRKFTLENYIFVLRNPLLLNAFLITILRTLIYPVVSVGITSLAAYGLSKRGMPGRKGLLVFLMIPMFIGGTIITNYVLFAKLRLLNNFLVYILPTSYGFFNMIIIRTFMEQLPPEIEESVKIDGGGYLVIFTRIVVPLSKPVIATFLFFAVVYAWLDFSTALFYITKRSLQVVQFKLYEILIGAQVAEIAESLSSGAPSHGGTGGEIPTFQVLKMSTLVVVTFPLLFVYPFFQKYFMKGLMVGAIKA